MTTADIQAILETELLAIIAGWLGFRADGYWSAFFNAFDGTEVGSLLFLRGSEERSVDITQSCS